MTSTHRTKSFFAILRAYDPGPHMPEKPTHCRRCWNHYVRGKMRAHRQPKGQLVLHLVNKRPIYINP